MKRAVLGVGVLAAYVVAAYAMGRTTVGFRPVFDGFAPPQPYRYVSPPPDLRDTNMVPEPFDETYVLGGPASQGLTFTTPDGQVQLIVDSDAIPRLDGEPSVLFHISPLDPRRLPDPGGGLFVQGNAYRLEATYMRSRKDVALTKPVTVIVRYPFTATKLARLEARRWQILPSQLLQTSLQVFAESRELGTFAAVGPPHGGRRWWIPLVAAGAGVAAAFVGYRTGRRRKRKPARRPRQPRRRRP